jgi:hypothetical protein
MPPALSQNSGRGLRIHFVVVDVRTNQKTDFTMKLKVECYAGYRGAQEPIAFLIGDRRIAVMQITDRWLSAAHRYFKVQADDGGTYILRHDERSEQWDLTLFQAP